jgi:hypothetical protein
MMASGGAAQSKATADHPLAALAWLEGAWAAEKEEADGSKTLRESFFEWSPNRRTLRFWSFVTGPDDKRMPYVDGWYAWDPVEKKIRFGYTDPGAFYQGEVAVQDGQLDHVFTGHHANGRTSRWRYTLERAGDGSMPTRIYAEREGQWVEIVSLVYRLQKQ